MNGSQIYSDFWLEPERYSEYITTELKSVDETFSIDLIRLASVRRVISNYVDILAGGPIPVYFKATGDSYNVGGKEIYITTAIHRRKDFDQAVGLALHEAAHTVLTDFDVIAAVPFHAPKSIWDFGRKNRISKPSLERFLKSMVNIVDDWYVDDWVISKTPGYIGYYEASYNECFNTLIIDQLLLSDEYRFPSLSSYEFRIINFTNPLTDLGALPGLEEVAKEIDISNISRLDTTEKRVNVAFNVVEIVTKHLQEKSNLMEQGKAASIQKIDVKSFFNRGGTGQESSSVSLQKPKKEDSDTDRAVKDIADVLAQRPKKDEENKAMVSQTSNMPGKEISKEIKQAVDRQVQYVHGNVGKEGLHPAQKDILDIIEKHGICLVYVPVPVAGNEAAVKVGCILVKKLSMELIEAGRETFPMASFGRSLNGAPQPNEKTAEAVQKGIQLGSKLGRKLIVRREENPIKNIRKTNGKINRRLLYSAGFEAEDIFEKIKIVKFARGSLHITVDASTSMVGDKWNRTLTMCVAICKAASMVDNIHVTVSFRATKPMRGIEMPYIVLAYDSNTDKFSKVKHLFKYLSPCGCTPEGLAFGAIMGIFTEASPDEKDRYFLNISDGEPYFLMKSPISGQNFFYSDGIGVEHTRSQVSKIRQQGIQVLSYYIQDDATSSPFLSGTHDTRKNFQRMYGKDAKYIRTNQVVELARTLNELFLRGT